MFESEESRKNAGEAITVIKGKILNDRILRKL
jgi:hypothetical protein